MSTIFHGLIYQPIYNVLIFLYDIIPGGDFGIAIIAVTILLKAALIPLSKKQIQSQKRMQEIQPKLKEIQLKYKNDKEKQTKEVMKFYKENKVNPFSGCFPIIVQLIFLIAIYRVIINISDAGLVVNGKDLYSFVANPGEINKVFIGLVDLLKPSIPIAILAAAAQFWQTKLMMSKINKNNALAKKDKDSSSEPDFSEIMNKQMLILGPALTLFIGIKFAAALSVYWLFSTLFSVAQQLYIFKKEDEIKK
ncbi:MAG: YidC/Oxa1 family membrane protein insertase [Candidatus Moranbacteria bacterium]|jgi:YidC/Oxa1 family membrane protein insertase|nr:YidC/Oxa1 family membrane protein insertase [Candidatus Moranbacteria bacterium]